MSMWLVRLMFFEVKIIMGVVWLEYWWLKILLMEKYLFFIRIMELFV